MAEHSAPDRIVVVRIIAPVDNAQADAIRMWHQQRAPAGTFVMVALPGMEVMPQVEGLGDVLAELRAVRSLLERWENGGLPTSRGAPV